MKNINLQLSVEEVNLILEALGNLPFSRVYALIANIQAQASQQLNTEGQTQDGSGSGQSVETKD